MVGLQLNVPLLSTCKHHSGAAFNVTPTVSINGLTGTQTSEPHLVLTGDAPFDGVSAPWSQSDGTISVTPSSETMAGRVYYFSFTVTNKAEGQEAPSITMTTDTIQDTAGQEPEVEPDAYTAEVVTAGSWASAHHTSGAFLAAEEVRAMFIRSPGLYNHTSVAQTTSHPCADNNITVTLEINVPLYAACRTNFTLTGLLNTATATPYIASWTVVHDSNLRYFTNVSGVNVSSSCSDENCSCPDGVPTTDSPFDYDCGCDCQANWEVVETRTMACEARPPDCTHIKNGLWNNTAQTLTVEVFKRIEPGEAVTFIVPSATAIRIPRRGVRNNDPEFLISAKAGTRSILPISMKTVQGIGSLLKSALSYNPPKANTTATIIFRFESVAKLHAGYTVDLSLPGFQSPDLP
ncbi:MAG: hypothetical protein ACPIOQ_60070, partial [Promethearchaeia archaeon]